MSSRPSPTGSDAADLDDFEWPPKADNVSVHEIETDPWQAEDAPATAPTVTVTVRIDEAVPALPRTRRAR